MKYMKIGFAAIAASLAFAGCDNSDTPQTDEKQLRIYTWADYIAPEVIQGFEQEYDCHVAIDTFDSNETMLETLKNSKAAYDIITPSSYYVARMATERYIVELDQGKLANIHANFDDTFAPQVLDPAFRYSVPYAVTYAGFCYSKNRIPVAADINSWKILEDSRLRGRVTLLDDIREVIGAGLMSNGFSVNSVNPEEIEKAVETVLAWSKNVKKLDSESYKSEVPSGATWIGHGYSTDAIQVILGDDDEGMPQRTDIGFALPREGFTIAFDEMVISSKSQNPDLAYKFMNYVYEGKIAKANMEYIYGPCPVKPGIDALDPAFREKIIPSEEVLQSGQVINSISYIPGARELYDKAWRRIKTACEEE